MPLCMPEIPTYGFTSYYFAITKTFILLLFMMIIELHKDRKEQYHNNFDNKINPQCLTDKKINTQCLTTMPL